MFVTFSIPCRGVFLFYTRVDSPTSGWQYFLGDLFDNQLIPPFDVSNDGYLGQLALKDLESGGKRNSSGIIKGDAAHTFLGRPRLLNVCSSFSRTEA